MNTLSIVIPAYNERATLLSILCKVLMVDLSPEGLAKEVVIVDDGSTDGTRELVARLARDWRGVLEPALLRRGLDPERAFRDAVVRGLEHPHNAGKTAALRTGFQAATGDYIVVQDADLEYDPEDYHRLLKPMLDGRADVVYGSRFNGVEHRALAYWHSMGNRLLTLLSNMVTDLHLTDMETCYKLFRAEVIKAIDIQSDRFGFEPEITVKVAKLGARVYEVPISYHGRNYDAGKKISWKDGVETLYCLGRFRLSSRVVHDEVLEVTLKKMSGLSHLNRAVFDAIRPWLGERVLEAGAGHGNITQFLAHEARELLTSDIAPRALRALEENFGQNDNVRVLPWDMTEAPELPPGDAPPDTVVAMNVLEHIEDEALALRRCRELLLPRRGRLILQVPAHEALYSLVDKKLGHHRRYGRERLRGLLEEAGFELEHLQWFNFLGYFGWLANSRRGNDKLSTGQLAAYQALSRYALAAERGLPLPTGLSLIAVARPAGRE